MFQHRLRSCALLLGLSVLMQAAWPVAPTTAQEARKSAPHSISYGNMRVSNYQKITVGLAGIHVTGMDTLFEFREKDRGLHRLHADDVRVSTAGNGVSGELSGNLHYTLLQPPPGSKIIDGTAAKIVDGTAERALYRQPGGKEKAAVTLLQAHTSLFRDGNEIAKLDAGQVVANQEDDTITGTGAVHITAQLTGHHVDLTADKIIWNRRANTLEASGRAHIAYTGPDKKDGSADADRIKIDMKNLEFEIE